VCRYLRHRRYVPLPAARKVCADSVLLVRQDPSLDFLRDAAAQLLADGVLAGYLVSSVQPYWGLGHPFRLQERVWLTIEWADGQRNEDIEDYEPWVLLDGLRAGWLDWDEKPHEGRYKVEWVHGDEQVVLMHRLQPHEKDRG
jgi:hypothetical protein